MADTFIRGVCQLGKAQLLQGGKEGVKAAIISLIKAKDITTFDDVVEAARKFDEYEAMVPYLLMVRKSLKDPKVDTEIVYAYARTDELSALEDFLSKPNAANLQTVGDRCFEENLLEAAKVLYTSLSNWGALASTLVKPAPIPSLQEAIKSEHAQDVERSLLCVRRRGRVQARAVVRLEHHSPSGRIRSTLDFYQQRGNFEELIQLMEAGTGLDRRDMGIFTELGILYAYHKRDKLHEHSKLFSQRINIPKLIRVCEDVHCLGRALFLVCPIRRIRQRRRSHDETPRRLGTHPIQRRVRQTFQRGRLLQSDQVLPLRPSERVERPPRRFTI